MTLSTKHNVFPALGPTTAIAAAIRRRAVRCPVLIPPFDLAMTPALSRHSSSIPSAGLQRPVRAMAWRQIV